MVGGRGETETRFLRAWLWALASFEVPNVVNFLLRHEQVVKLYLRHGKIDANQQAQNRVSVLTMAMQNGHEELAHFLRHAGAREKSFCCCVS